MRARKEGNVIVSEHYEHYSMVIEWSDEDQAYIVTVPELPRCRTHGLTYQEAVSQGEDAIDSWMSARLVSGRSIPSSRVFSLSGV